MSLFHIVRVLFFLVIYKERKKVKKKSKSKTSLFQIYFFHHSPYSNCKNNFVSVQLLYSILLIYDF